MSQEVSTPEEVLPSTSVRLLSCTVSCTLNSSKKMYNNLTSSRSTLTLTLAQLQRKLILFKSLIFKIILSKSVNIGGHELVVYGYTQQRSSALHSASTLDSLLAAAASGRLSELMMTKPKPSLSFRLMMTSLG